MMVLVTYDISMEDTEGPGRLRRVAKRVLITGCVFSIQCLNVRLIQLSGPFSGMNYLVYMMKIRIV